MPIVRFVIAMFIIIFFMLHYLGLTLNMQLDVFGVKVSLLLIKVGAKRADEAFDGEGVIVAHRHQQDQRSCQYVAILEILNTKT